MPIKITKQPVEQIERLAKATAAQVDEAKAFYVQSTLADDFRTPRPQLNGHREAFLTASKSLETVGIDLVTRFASDTEAGRRAWHDLLWSAFRLRRSIAIGADNSIEELLDVVVDGLLANRQPELRLILQSQAVLTREAENPQAWGEFALNSTLRAFFLLVRKGNGYEDLETALSIIARLRELQEGNEEGYLNSRTLTSETPDTLSPEQKSARLVGLYNLARAVELCGQFLAGRLEGEQITAQGVKDDITRFGFNCREVLSGLQSDLVKQSDRLITGLRCLVDASVFAASMPNSTRSFLRKLAGETREKPVLELWYSQREAIDQRLLDLTRNAVVISMPTSAGKTLLAEMAITEAYNDNPKAKIVYLAPTRALVTQTSLTLRRDIGTQLRIRVATPMFELDPVEQEVLQDDFNVLVTTPEKFDLLIRLKHPSVDKVSLVIVDEAHNISDEKRGARLELLLATVRREKPRTRFLLLTPFAENAHDIARWLAGNSGAPIILDWKPNERVIGAVKPGKKIPHSSERDLLFVSLKSVHSDCPGGREVSLGLVPNDTDSKGKLTIAATIRLAQARKGGVLLLASSPAKAETRARELAPGMPDITLSASVEMVCRFLDTEAGGTHPLSALMKKGVAYHHAGLSAEARYLVERLVEEGAISILCATTTLAQGVHFPLSVAVIESHQRRVKNGNTWEIQDIQPWEFWNITGRVGRTLEDKLGTIVFPARDQSDCDKIEKFLARDSARIVSSLLALIGALDGRTNISFSRTLIEKVPSLSAFLQYIVHAMAVSGPQAAREGLDRLLFGSLVYEQAHSTDAKLADELIRVGRLYINSLFDRKAGALSLFVKVADDTGFSSPSVDFIQRHWVHNADEPNVPEDWAIDNIFSPEGETSAVLTRVIETLGQIPELKLGTEDKGRFDAKRIARITTAWVNGVPVKEIADKEYEGNLLECTRHLFGTVVTDIPWGMRAVQRIAFSGDEAVADVDLLPAMVFHGVRSKEAIALRMLSVPRIVAEGLAKQWRSEGTAKLSSAFDWLQKCSPEKWSSALPKNSQLSGTDCQVLWGLIEGTQNWKETFKTYV